jgi:hypothetical protein
MMSFGDDRFGLMSGQQGYQWNRKLCFQARDTLYGCVEAQENGNKYRCPDELYAY